MAVSHNQLKRPMAKEFRDGSQINPGHNQSTGEGMSVAMPSLASSRAAGNQPRAPRSASPLRIEAKPNGYKQRAQTV